MNLKTAEQ